MPHLPLTTPDDIGLDARQLRVAYDLLDEWTGGDHPAVPGGAILVGRHGKMVAPHFSGRQGPEPDAPAIRADGVFLLASITKPLTYLAGMMLVERGLMTLNDPVAMHLPDFAAHHKEEIRVHHLFTHTSGLPDMLENDTALRRSHAPLEAFVSGAIRDTMPAFQPGADFHYQSMGTLVVAELVRVLSGMTIHDFLRREVFEPLGLASTSLGIGAIDPARAVRVQTPPAQAGGDWGWNSDYWRKFGAPWGGGFSSPADFAVICQMMLNGGRIGDTRIISPATARAMTENRLEDYPDLPELIRRTRPWGLGWALNHPGQPDAWSDLLSRRVFGHIGSTGTMAWMDADRDGFCLIFTSAIRANAPWRLTRLANAMAAAFEG